MEIFFDFCSCSSHRYNNNRRTDTAAESGPKTGIVAAAGKKSRNRQVRTSGVISGAVKVSVENVRSAIVRANRVYCDVVVCILYTIHV